MILESTGKTEAEAIEKALLQLNLDRDDVSVEVISRAKTGFLGFGVQPAKVKITYELPEPEKIPEPEPEPEKIPVPEPKITPVENYNPMENVTIISIPPHENQGKVGEKVENVENSAQEIISKAEEDTKQDEVAEKVAETPEPTAEKKTKKPKNPSKAPPTKAEQEAVIQGIIVYLEGLLPLLHVDATPKVWYDGDNFQVNLEGENLGALIGRRGETLDAIQQITGYSVNKICPKRIRIFMDAENYRVKRQETLIKLAEKVAGEAVKHRKNVPLEPMNAYERHIIHTALERFPQVSTYSTGTDPNRRTVVAYRGKKRAD